MKRASSAALVARQISWRQAFPEWHLIHSEIVDPDHAVILSSPEEQMTMIQEIAAYFRGSVEYVLGQLYPLVPALFPVFIGNERGTVPFSAIAHQPAVDALRTSKRRTVREFHRTLAQANTAAAIRGMQQWPEEPITGGLASNLFRLDPIDFYLVTHIGIGRRSMSLAGELLAETADISDISAYLAETDAHAFEKVHTPELVDWWDALDSGSENIDVLDAARSHPQLLSRLPMLDITLAEALGLLIPDRELRDGVLVRSTHSGSVTVDDGDRALGLAASFPGISTAQMAGELGISVAKVEKVLAPRGLARVVSLGRTPADTTWSVRTWSRLGIANAGEAKALFDEYGLQPHDLDLPESAWIIDKPWVFEPKVDEPTTEPAPASEISAEGPAPEFVPEITPGEEPKQDELPLELPESGQTEPETEGARELLSSESLHDWEEEVARRLVDANLVADTNPSAIELKRLFEVYGRRFRLARGRHTPTERVIGRFPATTLATLVGAASTEFENNTFWSEYFSAIGVEQNQIDETSLRYAIPTLLRQFGLDELPEIPQNRYVERLTVHAGIPASSFGRLLDAVISYIALVDNRVDRPFRDWILEPSHEDLFNNLTSPAKVFISSGGQRAAQYLAALVDIIGEVVADPNIDGTNAPQTFAGKLPPLVLEALASAFKQRNLGEEILSRKRRSREEPTIHLGADDTVLLRLPAPSAHVDKPWAVTLDANVRHISPDRLDRTRAVEVVIDNPARRVVVSHPSYNSPIEMRLFESGKPLVVFTRTGEHLPISSRLPRAEVAVLCLSTVAAVNSDTKEAVNRGTFPAPRGWTGWKVETWDLGETQNVHATGHLSQSSTDAGTGEGLYLSVGKRNLPELDFSDGEAVPLEGVTHRGLPVFGRDRPWILLPALFPSDVKGWTVQYRRSGTTFWTTQDEYFPQETESRELFTGEAQLLGTFEVRVSGPESMVFEREFFVADGLVVTYDEDIRIPAGAEMTPITAHIESESPTLTASADEVYFPPSTSHRDISLSVGTTTEQVRIRPPRLEFRLTPVGAVPVWSDRRISRHPSDFLHSTLTLRGVPEGVGVDVRVLDSSGYAVHTTRLDRVRAGSIYSLTADVLAKPAENAKFGELIVNLHYPGGDKYTSPLVRFSALGHDYRVELDGNAIVVEGLTTSEQVDCHVWQLERPWLEPLVSPIVDGRAELPESVASAGSLRVDVQVSDPWDPVTPGRFPNARSIRLSRSGNFSATDRGLLSQFLSGESPVPHFGAELIEAWAALALLDRELDSHDRSRYNAIAEVMTQNPRVAANSLVASEIPNAEKLAHFIGTGLVFSSFDTAIGASRESIAAEPWLSLLLGLSDIPFLGAEAKSAALSRIEEIGGPEITSILTTGVDPNREVTLDRAGVQLIEHGTILQDSLAERRQVPGGLLSDASRCESFLALLDSRNDLPRGVLGDWYILAKSSGNDSAMSFVRRIPQLASNITIRSDNLDGVDPFDKPWAAATYVSLAFAIYARLIARGHGPKTATPYLNSVKRTWSEFARLQPLETSIDLVLADALVAHYDFSSRGYSPFAIHNESSDS
jgi:hypothetical protein